MNAYDYELDPEMEREIARENRRLKNARALLEAIEARQLSNRRIPMNFTATITITARPDFEAEGVNVERITQQAVREAIDRAFNSVTNADRQDVGITAFEVESVKTGHA